MSLKVISRPPTTTKNATGAIVALHGWGANAEDLAPLATYFNLPDYHFFFPDAPFPHNYTDNGKMWYDFESMSQNFQSDDSSLLHSRELLIKWLQDLPKNTGISWEKTILLGFSQGGAMTFDVGLKLPLAGLVILSGYIHPIEFTIDYAPPILMIHGLQDAIIPIARAKNNNNTLLEQGFNVQFRTFNMGHEITFPVIDLVRTFVLQNS